MKKRALRKYLNIILIIVLMGSLSSPGFVNAAGNEDQGAGTPEFCAKNPTHKSCAAYQDKTAPSSPTINLSPNVTDWTNQSVSFTLTPGEDTQGGSGVDRTEYKIGTNGTWQSYNTGQSVTVPGEGVITIFATSTDKANNTSAEATAVVKIDKAAPTSPILTASPSDWTNQDKVTVTLLPGTDNGSGVLRNEYKIDSGNWKEYGNSPIEITSEGVKTIYGRTIDRAGNISLAGETVIKIDRTGPTTPEILLSTSNWTNEDVTFTITPGIDSGSGFQKTQYKIGVSEDNWIDYTEGARITVTNEGETTIQARTLDNLNNPSAVAESVVKIDKNASSRPTILLSHPDWTNTNVTFEIQNGVKTGGSPIVKSEYKLNDGNWTDYKASGEITAEGVTKITARTIDEAGNESIETTEYARIDITKPSSPSISPSTTEWTKGDVSFTITSGTDEVNGSGVNKTEYKFGENGTWIKYEGQVTFSAEGQTTIFARTSDKAGNFSDSVSIMVKIDKTAPSAPVIASNHNGWTKEDVTVTLTDGQDELNGSGYSITEYKINNGEWQTYISPFTINQQGEFKIHARSVDNAGNTTEADPIEVKIDQTAPTKPTINADTNWTNADSVTVTIEDGTDSGSGVAKTEYRIGETGDWITYSDSFLVTDQGVNKIYARSTDYVGNIGEEKVIEVKIDRTEPDEPYINLSRTDWTKEAVTFTIENINDNLSGVSKIMYKIGDDGEWLVYTPEEVITVDKEGVTPIYVKVVDKAGNINDDAVKNAKYDITAPTSPTFEVSSGDAGWTNNDVEITFNSGEDLPHGDEEVSGVKQTEYRFEGTEDWIKYTDPIQISNQGIFTIYAQTKDNAGNVSVATQVTVKIDKSNPTAPTFNLSKDGWTNQGVTVSIENGQDQVGLSGVSKTEYKIGEGQWTEYIEPFTINQEGSTTVLARTKDNAGNVSENGTATVKIDKSGPVITVSGNKTEYQVDQIIQIKCTVKDELSGVSSTTCQDINANAYDLGLGTHSYTFEATDIAGNETSKSVSFNIGVTYTSLSNLTAKFVTKPDIAHSLQVKLEAAQDSIKRGNIKAANNQMNAFKNEVLAQRGKTLTADQASLLIQLLDEVKN
ncbi:OmpL47-type beta-barrel domain-containing protein [Neobacillus sp. GCM10023253]|uniref:OmpL47-type beta-barrel domain-containing protein n=1 Tax=Neobacillus sp. GCM10023253 TaxID=3252644 RepID=UPI003607FF0F